MLHLIGEGMTELLPIALIALAIWWVNRVGPEVDNKIVRMTAMYFQPTAKLISWAMCVTTLTIALVGAIAWPNKIAALEFGIVPVAHLVLMLRKKYSFAYWCASGEILMLVFGFASYCVGNPEHGLEGPLNITPGTRGFGIFIIGSLILAIPAWICHRAAKDIWNG